MGAFSYNKMKYWSKYTVRQALTLPGCKCLLFNSIYFMAYIPFHFCDKFGELPVAAKLYMDTW